MPIRLPRPRLLSAAAALLLSVSPVSAQVEVAATIQGDAGDGQISRHLYGHFAEHLGRCIYDGLYVGVDSDIPNTDGVRNDIIAALKEINVPNLRWPGGCFADDYHWRDGIGPREERPVRPNIHWGGLESNAFGSHEFLNLCETLGADPYLAGNVGSGTPREMAEWIQYLTYPEGTALAEERKANGREEPYTIPFWGVGNENWGCGGNMRPEYYADLYRRFATYCRNFGGNDLTLVACGPSGPDHDWTKAAVPIIGRRMDAYSLHFYTIGSRSWPPRMAATGFDEGDWIQLLESCLWLDEFLTESDRIMDETDPQNRIPIFLDEWGTWYRGTPGQANLWQQNTLRDALVAGLSFHIFHDHRERVKMANIAQTVNVLQALVLTEDQKMLLTPTYHVFNLYKHHQDATYLPVEIDSPAYEHDGRSIPMLSVGASRDRDGVTVSIVNANPNQAATLKAQLPGVTGQTVTGQLLTADELDAHNTFDNPDNLKPVAFNDASIEAGTLTVEVPAKSVLVLRVTE